MEHDHRPRVIIVGLGPAGASYLTEAARQALIDAPMMYLRTERCDAASEFIAAGASALDHHYERAESFSEVYAGIVDELVEGAHRYGRVAYGVPGSPYVCEATVAALRDDSRVQTEIVPGLSFLDLCWDRLGIDPVSAHVRLCDAQSFATDALGEHGPFLVAQLHARPLASELKLALEERPGQTVTILHHLGHSDEAIVEVALDDLDRAVAFDHLSCCFVPALDEPVADALLGAVEIVRTLRSACPWDKEQTHRSLARHLIEETYEAIEAIDELGEDLAPQAAAHLEEELGDVLCQVLFHATIAAEEGLFSLADVAQTLTDKLVHRHPHVFGDVELKTADSVVARWEQIKQQEKGRASVMDGIPAALPALSYVTKIERKAAAMGLGYVASKAHDAELAERCAQLVPSDEQAVGELLFALARVAAASGIDPEAALRIAAHRYRDRFIAAEQAALAAGESFSDLSPETRHAYLSAVPKTA